MIMKSNCFNEKKNGYKVRLYTTIRKLGIRSENFYEFVKIEVLI